MAKRYRACTTCDALITHRARRDELARRDQLVCHAPCPSCQGRGRRECKLCREINGGAWGEANELEIASPDGDVELIRPTDNGHVSAGAADGVDPLAKLPARVDVANDPFAQDEIDLATGRRWDTKPAKRYTALERAIAIEVLRSKKNKEPISDAEIARRVGCTRAHVGQVRPEFERPETPLDVALKRPPKFRSRRERELVAQDRARLEADLDRLIRREKRRR
jgi:hypothetical protein